MAIPTKKTALYPIGIHFYTANKITVADRLPKTHFFMNGGSCKIAPLFSPFRYPYTFSLLKLLSMYKFLVIDTKGQRVLWASNDSEARKQARGNVKSCTQITHATTPFTKVTPRPANG